MITDENNGPEYKNYLDAHHFSILMLLVGRQDRKHIRPVKSSCISNPIIYTLEDLWGTWSDLQKNRLVEQELKVAVATATKE